VQIPAAGGIVFDEQRRLLLIQRAKPPSAGRWSVPGGKCEAGETAADACIREVAEETGLDVEVVSYAGRVSRASPDGGVFVIDDFVCRVVGGAIVAGDDADKAGWFRLADLAVLPLAEGLLDALAGWDLLPD
jgi:mutator protein MutT